MTQSSPCKLLIKSLFYGVLASVLVGPFLKAATLKLKNGADLIGEQDKRSPRDFLMITFQGGNGLLPKEEQGAGQILTAILDEGPAGMASEAYRKELFLLGGEIHYSTSARLASASIIAPHDRLDDVLVLALKTLKKPKFDQETYQLARAKVEANLAQREDDMGSTLRYVAVRDAFNYHPDVLDGTPSRLSLKNVDFKKVEAALPILFDARYLVTVAVGPSDPRTWQKILDTRLAREGFLSQTSAKRSFSPPSQESKSQGPQKVVLVHRAGATDNQVLYLMRRKIPKDNNDQIALELANKLLGGGMQGSLFRVLREERGLTYGVGSGVNEDLGYWSVASFASTDKLRDLMAGIQEVVKAQAQVKVDQATADLVKSDMLTQWREGRELPSDRLSDALAAKTFNRDLNFQETMDQWIMKASETLITQMGATYFNLSGASIYVMGDKAKVQPLLEQLGYKAVDIRIVDGLSIL